MSRWYRWEYYPPAHPKAVKDGIKAKSKRGRIGDTWWSERWIGVLESFDMGARLGRGRSYARRGQVARIDIAGGVVEAKVQGTRSKPYTVTIRLKPLPDRKWHRITDAMASRAIFAAKLMAGEMPKNIEEAFSEAGASLFPSRRADLKTECSCPDWANPCKHIAAVYYLLAERFDEDPFLLFMLRGRTREQIMSSISENRAKAQAVPASSAPRKGKAVKSGPTDESALIENFWKVGDGIDTFTIRLGIDGMGGADAGGFADATPFTLDGKDVSIIFDSVYRKAREAAMKEVGGGDRR